MGWFSSTEYVIKREIDKYYVLKSSREGWVSRIFHSKKLILLIFNADLTVLALI
jgi:hypothetical protein